MATSDLAGGRKVSGKLFSDEIAMFLLSKEFGWTPKQIKECDKKDIDAIIHILSVYNNVKNSQNKNK